MTKMNSILSPRMGAKPSKKMPKKFDIGGASALEIAEEHRRAKKWFESLSESVKEDWLNLARSEKVIDAWEKFKSSHE